MTRGLFGSMLFRHGSGIRPRLTRNTEGRKARGFAEHSHSIPFDQHSNLRRQQNHLSFPPLVPQINFSWLPPAKLIYKYLYILYIKSF